MSTIKCMGCLRYENWLAMTSYKIPYTLYRRPYSLDYDITVWRFCIQYHHINYFVLTEPEALRVVGLPGPHDSVNPTVGIRNQGAGRLIQGFEQGRLSFET